MVHMTFSLIAIGAGAVVLTNSKGTRWHRTFGHIYATSMVGLIVTAFSIYDLTGNFGGVPRGCRCKHGDTSVRLVPRSCPAA